MHLSTCDIKGGNFAERWCNFILGLEISKFVARKLTLQSGETVWVGSEIQISTSWYRIVVEYLPFLIGDSPDVEQPIDCTTLKDVRLFASEDLLILTGVLGAYCDKMNIRNFCVFLFCFCLCSTTGCGHDPGAKDDSPKHGEDSNLREKDSFHSHGMRKKMPPVWWWKNCGINFLGPSYLGVHHTSLVQGLYML